MARIARYLNGFIVIGVILLITGIVGAATHNRLLAEPGQPVNPYAWLLYIAASAIMFVNGVLSIRAAAHHATTGHADADKAEVPAKEGQTARR